MCCNNLTLDVRMDLSAKAQTVTMRACCVCVHVCVRLSDAKQSFNRLISHQEYKALDDSSRFK
jgi:hypothetical protein